MPRGVYKRKLATQEEVLSRFLAKVCFKKSDCWEWNGAIDEHGYGRFHVPGTKSEVITAHEFSYCLFIGPVSKGLELDHLCHNPKCLNPDHLEQVTHQKNMVRGLAFNPNRGNCLKTHCIHGHPLDETNTYISKDGHRHCLACITERARKYSRLKHPGGGGIKNESI
jgi:hypothetical protein